MRRALVFWFTGVSGAGKSCIAALVRDRLKEEGRAVLVLDGDALRARLHRHPGFAEADIREDDALVAALCEESRASFDVILVPVISPSAQSRALARAALAPGFYEVHCTAGAIDNLVGFSPGARYDIPPNPDLRLDAGGGDPALGAARLLAFMHARLARHPAAVMA